MKIEILHWEIDVDVAATWAFYAGTPQGAADICECPPCRNFAAQRSKAYPAETLDWFRQLGIDPAKETDNSSLMTAPGEHLYFVMHCFVGTVKPDAVRAQWEQRQARLNEIIAKMGAAVDEPTRTRLAEEAEGLWTTEADMAAFPNSPTSFLDRGPTPPEFPRPIANCQTMITLPWVIEDAQE